MKTLASALVALALACGCSSVSVRKLASPQDYQEGVRFYRPAPYLAVTKEATKEGALYKSQILFLPDPSQEYVVEWSAGLGKITPNFTLAEGWNLTGFNSTIETGAAAAISSLADLAGAIAGLREMNAAPAAIQPGLYRMVAGPGGWTVDKDHPVLLFPDA